MCIRETPSYEINGNATWSTAQEEREKRIEMKLAWVGLRPHRACNQSPIQNISESPWWKVASTRHLHISYHCQSFGGVAKGFTIWGRFCVAVGCQIWRIAQRKPTSLTVASTCRDNYRHRELYLNGNFDEDRYTCMVFGAVALFPVQFRRCTNMKERKGESRDELCRGWVVRPHRACNQKFLSKHFSESPDSGQDPIKYGPSYFILCLLPYHNNSIANPFQVPTAIRLKS
ncbi:hypothetical protein GOBAR_AA12718 [Gossypium barbadense]|uniref:Uncharacterized protein n=1 Tax=Gossypium barbadense TaxID=3634 RepID=A0A2P5XX72_GOSBA|nr:hypothetical protein GOBAR_AA12718 [Gossypium barbadense]